MIQWNSPAINPITVQFIMWNCPPKKNDSISHFSKGPKTTYAYVQVAQPSSSCSNYEEREGGRWRKSPKKRGCFDPVTLQEAIKINGYWVKTKHWHWVKLTQYCVGGISIHSGSALNPVIFSVWQSPRRVEVGVGGWVNKTQDVNWGHSGLFPVSKQQLIFLLAQTTISLSLCCFYG